MARKSRLSIVKPQIESFFNQNNRRVYSPPHLSGILTEHGDKWRLPHYITTKHFISYLMKRSHLREISIPGYILYSWGDLSNESIFEIASTLKPRAYFSHYSAVFLHDLTEQIPKNIYITQEQSGKGRSGELTQEGIDEAFQKPIRRSNNTISCMDYTITLLNGMATGGTGVIPWEESFSKVKLKTTDIERTLIDITVRPEYAGGVHEVIKAYETAKGRVSLNKLKAYLFQLDFLYPYHQAIGFCLEYTGYPPHRVQLIENFAEMKYDFYLSHAMGEMSYSPKWRLYYPKSLDS